MIAATTPIQQVIVYEGPDGQPFDGDRRFALLSELLKSGYAAILRREADAVAREDSRTQILIGQFAGTIPAWTQPRRERGDLCVLDVTSLAIEEVLQRVAASCQQAEQGTKAGWKPWFPVIDYDRCTNCMQCLSFCLFDVYGVSDQGKIQVQNQSNCKTDCPACSRVCPEVAILFPKYKAGPINGDEVNTDDVRREAMKVDISALLGGDIYSMLRDRSEKAKSRFSRERDDDRALKERQRCLTKLKEAANIEIPPEVLSSLPSLDQIQQKATQARQKANAAIAANERRASQAKDPAADQTTSPADGSPE